MGMFSRRLSAAERTARVREVLGKRYKIKSSAPTLLQYTTHVFTVHGDTAERLRAAFPEAEIQEWAGAWISIVWPNPDPH